MTSELNIINSIFKGFSTLKNGDAIKTRYSGIYIIIAESGYYLVAESGQEKYFKFPPRNYEIDIFKNEIVIERGL